MASEARSTRHATEFDFDRDWKLYIDGDYRDSADGGALAVEDPATGETFATAPAGTVDDVNDAVAAAARTTEAWGWTAPAERAAVLFEIADRIEEHHDELVALETAENGKPLDQSAKDVSSAAETFRFYAGGADKFFSDTIDYTPEKVRQKVVEPYGVVGIVLPWNWPPMHTADFASVALAAGNTVVLKPSSDTPLSSLRIAELADGVLPDGVFNVVSGGVGAALTGHEDVDMIAFTGNNETGEKVLQAASNNITPAMMELGGKNPAIVFDDAETEKTVSGVVASTFYNSGQACSDAERILIQENVYDEFRDELAEAVESLVVADGRDPSAQIGPMENEEQVEKFDTYLEGALEDGAEVVAQADVPDDPALAGGHWVPPTLLDNVEPDFEVACEEVFGPLAVLLPFADEDEAVAIANDVDFGLSATVWTQDVSRAHRVSARVKAGLVAINTTGGGGTGLAFGGYNRSGIGRKKDFSETMRDFTQVKSIEIDVTDELHSL